jgi:hypothetical protein
MPDQPKKTRTGACLCGSIRYAFEAAPLATAVCHCKACQRQTGSSFSSVVCLAEDDLILSNRDTLRTFHGTADSGLPVQRNFCGACGSPIYSTIAARPGLAFLKAGTLDDTTWLAPTTHLWCETKQNWVDIPDEVTSLARGRPAT